MRNFKLSKMYTIVFIFVLLIPALVNAQTMVLVGGELSDGNDIVYGKIVELAGGRGAKIGVMTMANDDPVADGIRIVDVFNRIYGANAVWINITQTYGGDDPNNVALLQQQTGFFFGGGVRGRVLRALRRDGIDSPALLAIRDMLRTGKAVLSGSSAGMASQSSRAILMTGDTYTSLTFKNYTTSTEGLMTFPGPWVLDAHCSERGREGRMIRFLYDTQSLPDVGIPQGFSIDEDHALVVTNLYTRPIATVIGAVDGVHFFDVTNVVSNPSTSSDLQGASMSFYSVGDVIDLTTGEATIASWKLPLAGKETFANAVPSTDIFSINNPGEWRSVAKRLVDNRNDRIVTSYSVETDPVQYEVVLDSQSTVAYGGFSPNSPNTFSYSWTNITVGIRGL